jgi:deoxyribose-phosphate aldolase
MNTPTIFTSTLSNSLGRGSVPIARIVTPADLAAYIDHTLLKSDASTEDIVRHCQEARTHRFATVCINSSYVELAAQQLDGTSTIPIAVVGFPLGVCLPQAKAFEAQLATAKGAREIDMVLNVGALKSKNYALVASDIRAVVDAAAPFAVKVILETASLTDEEKRIACVLASSAGAAFVKTSTGFGGGGATVDDVKLMRHMVGESVGVKASGGIRSTEEAMKMIAAGACRLGTSASVAIVTGAHSEAQY